MSVLSRAAHDSYIVGQFKEISLPSACVNLSCFSSSVCVRLPSLLLSEGNEMENRRARAVYSLDLNGVIRTILVGDKE